jgi:hypothetical protein
MLLQCCSHDLLRKSEPDAGAAEIGTASIMSGSNLSRVAYN